MKLQGNIVDILNRRIYRGAVYIEDGFVKYVKEEDVRGDHFILPGFIDAHVHIESSMLVPSEFARLAVNHGTVATVSDPHEITNVLGIKGVEFMIANGKEVPFKFHFGAPSCVPATGFETAGAEIDADAIAALLKNADIYYLAEMMNYPGVLFDDVEVLKKIAWAHRLGKPVDGHAPGLRGEDLSKYIRAGITTDHECFTYEEGLEKLQKGMKVIVREGSAAKNFEALIPLLENHYQDMMFCSDDKHPDDLIAGHINLLCARAVAKGLDLFKVLQAACINPIEHYGLPVGSLREGDSADLTVVKDVNSFKVLQTFINGELASENGVSRIGRVAFEVLNNFKCNKKEVNDFHYPSSTSTVRAIEALDGELLTNEIEAEAKLKQGNLVSNIEKDILKITVVNRYKDQVPAIAFVKNFGLKEGAIASSVGHDSHNVIAVGISDEMLCKAVNLVISSRGGICAVTQSEEVSIPLPVGGIMSDKSGEEVGKAYAMIDRKAKEMGSTLRAPFMTLSFMALLVIPSLKLSDQGLFDGKKFLFTPLLIS